MNVHQPKITEKLFFLFSGAVISTPFPILANSLIAYVLALQLPSPYYSVVTIALIAPILEEFAKAYPLFFRHGETERSLVTLGFLTGLGFGIAEFLIYIFVLEAPVGIRLPLLLFHATNNTIIAYGIGRYKAFYFYFLAVLLHFVYNFSIFFSGIFLIVAVLAVFTSYILAYFLYRRSRELTIKYT